MAELVACLQRGKVEILRPGEAPHSLSLPHLERILTTGKAEAKVVGLTRGRVSGELCYAIESSVACDVFAQVIGSGEERRLFHGVHARLSELDFSPADEALACTVEGPNGTSAIGVFSDDGKGLRTVTEGDVLDRAPRWVPGGRGEIVYASAGIGRTPAGRAVGRSPFTVHRLRFSDNTVEVLSSDAQYDYSAAVPATGDVIYALRRRYDGAPQSSPVTRWAAAVRGILPVSRPSRRTALKPHELVRITGKTSSVVAEEVFAFDVAHDEQLVYSSAAGVFRMSTSAGAPERIAALDQAEQVLIHW